VKAIMPSLESKRAHTADPTWHPIMTIVQLCIIEVLLKYLSMNSDMKVDIIATHPMKKVPNRARLSAAFPSSPIFTVILDILRITNKMILPSVKSSFEKKITALIPFN
jgi:hypothetical protein